MAVRATTRAIYTNGPIGGAFRGFGVPQAAVAQEALLDDVAAQLGVSLSTLYAYVDAKGQPRERAAGLLGKRGVTAAAR